MAPLTYNYSHTWADSAPVAICPWVLVWEPGEEEDKAEPKDQHYLIKHLSHLRFLYSLKLNVGCQEPAWGIPPMAKVMRKGAWQNTRQDQASGVPLDFLEHLPPKPESACFTVLCFPPTLLSLTGDCPPTTFFWKKLELLDNKSPGHNMSVSIQKPLWWLSSLPVGLVQLRMWLFEASHLREAQEA